MPSLLARTGKFAKWYLTVDGTVDWFKVTFEFLGQPFSMSAPSVVLDRLIHAGE